MTATSSGPIPVDLVVLIDTSSSMKDQAIGLSAAAAIAIDHAESSCPSDLRVAWFGLEGTWKGTQFDNSVRSYLTQTLSVNVSGLRGRKKGEVADGGAQEDGARNIEDITMFYDWRPGAARAIFYLSDEGLEGGGEMVTPESTAAANKAIAAAEAGGVTVHTYFGTTKSRYKADQQREFARVANATGGQAFTDQDISNGFERVLEKVICASRIIKEPTLPSAGFAPETHQDDM